jgi:hypothetical protein
MKIFTMKCPIVVVDPFLGSRNLDVLKGTIAIQRLNNIKILGGLKKKNCGKMFIYTLPELLIHLRDPLVEHYQVILSFRLRSATYIQVDEQITTMSSRKNKVDTMGFALTP